MKLEMTVMHGVLPQGLSRFVVLAQGCGSTSEAEDRLSSTRKALQDHMEFDAEKQTDVDYA